MTATDAAADVVLRRARALAENTAAIADLERTIRAALGNKLTPDGMHILAALASVDRPLTPGDLINETRRSSGQISRQLDMLQTSGLVVRVNSREDRRIVNVTITVDGRAALATTADAYLNAVSA